MDDAARLVEALGIAPAVVRGWPKAAPSRAELAAHVSTTSGFSDVEYFMASAVPDGDRWRLLFDWDDMMAVQNAGAGHWVHDDAPDEFAREVLAFVDELHR